MCISATTSTSGKSATSSDHSVAALEAAIVNLRASELILQQRLKRAQEELTLAKLANVEMTRLYGQRVKVT